MSFEKILHKLGKDVKIIKLTRTLVNGYYQTTEEIINAKAVVLPLSSEEKTAWTSIGITKAELKAYLKDEIHTGWKIEVEGVRYNVRAIEKYVSFVKAILEKSG